jgi:DNA polymerase III delta subunit
VQLSEEQKEYLERVINSLEEGTIPKKTIQKAITALNKLQDEIQNPLKVIGVLQREISTTFLKSHYTKSQNKEEKGEVILSLYLG